MEPFRAFITNIEKLEKSEDPIDWLLADVLRKERMKWLGKKLDERERMIKAGQTAGFLTN